MEKDLPIHHIHVRYGDRIHTIAHKGDVVDMQQLRILLSDIILNSKEFCDVKA